MSGVLEALTEGQWRAQGKKWPDYTCVLKNFALVAVWRTKGMGPRVHTGISDSNSAERWWCLGMRWWWKTEGRGGFERCLGDKINTMWWWRLWEGQRWWWVSFIATRWGWTKPWKETMSWVLVRLCLRCLWDISMKMSLHLGNYISESENEIGKV